MRNRWLGILCGSSIAISAAVVSAEPIALLGAARSENNHKGGRSAGDAVREVLPASQPVYSTQPVFLPGEVSIIHDWFRVNRRGLPPGLAKKDRLPPGLEKQLRKNGKLPPGLQKKVAYYPLPYELETQLRPVPTGYRRVVIAGNVVLMEPATGLIYDIVRNAIP